MRLMRLKFDQIRRDGGTQSRARFNSDLSKQYTEGLQSGVQYPPVQVVFDGTDYWLWEGFHRLDAHAYLGKETEEIEVEAEVTEGTLEHARWLAASANKEHDTAGLRRSSDDIRHATELALSTEEGKEKSDQQIADHVGVSRSYVQKIRASLATVASQPSQRKGRDGRTIRTANIGRGKRKQADSSPASGRGQKQIAARTSDTPPASVESQSTQAERHTAAQTAGPLTYLKDKVPDNNGAKGADSLTPRTIIIQQWNSLGAEGRREMLGYILAHLTPGQMNILPTDLSGLMMMARNGAWNAEAMGFLRQVAEAVMGSGVEGRMTLGAIIGMGDDDLKSLHEFLGKQLEAKANHQQKVRK